MNERVLLRCNVLRTNIFIIINFSPCQISLNYDNVALRVDERSSDSYEGRDDFFVLFFSGEVLKFVQAQIHFFRGLTFDFFLSLVQFLY